MTVGDALLAAMIKARQLYGMPGLGMSISVNGNNIIIPGEHGTPSTILMNGAVASTKDQIVNGARIELVPGKDGKDAFATIRDFIADSTPIQATIDGSLVTLEPRITMNGMVKPMDTIIQDRDTIIIQDTKTIAAALAKLDRNDLLQQNGFKVTVDQKPVPFKSQAVEFTVNGTKIQSSYVIKNGDVIAINKKRLSTPSEVANELGKKLYLEMNVKFNGETVHIRKPRFCITLDGTYASADDTILSGSHLDFTKLNDNPILFSDVFAFTDYQLPKNTAGTYQLLRNSSKIDFNDPIFDGDMLEITFI